jgi:hypothetical protein
MSLSFFFFGPTVEFTLFFLVLKPDNGFDACMSNQAQLLVWVMLSLVTQIYV